MRCHAFGASPKRVAPMFISFLTASEPQLDPTKISQHRGEEAHHQQGAGSGMDLSYLAPQIQHILTGPGVDLSTISAKRVRKQLVAGGLDEGIVRDHKSDIDALIAQIYESVSRNTTASPGVVAVPPSNGGKPTPSPANGSKAAVPKRKRSASPDSAYFEPPSSQPQPLANKKAKQANGATSTKQEQSDAELARQLSLELNSRSTRGASASSATTSRSKAKSSGKKAKRSKAIINSDGEDGEEGSSSGKAKAKGGFSKEFLLR